MRHSGWLEWLGGNLCDNDERRGYESAPFCFVGEPC